MKKNMAVIIPYKPRYPQNLIHAALESRRFCVLVTHRQMGKTVCAVNHLLKSALTNTRPAPRYFYIAPFLKQTKLIAWDYIKRFSAPLPDIKLSEAELCLQLPNGAKIWLLGADNPDALRGTYADGVVLDEYAQIKPDVFDEIVRPMLLSRRGWALFTGTPKGQNQFYELYQYDSEGRLVRADYYDETGTFEAYDVYTYNEAGITTSVETYEADGTLIRSRVYN